MLPALPIKECLVFSDQARAESGTQFISFIPTAWSSFCRGGRGLRKANGGGWGSARAACNPCTMLYCLPEGGMVTLIALTLGLARAGHTVGTSQDILLCPCRRTQSPGAATLKFSPQGPLSQPCPVVEIPPFPLPPYILLVLQGVCQMPPPPGSQLGLPLTQALGPKNLPIP